MTLRQITYCVLGLVITTNALAQTPFANLYWEANDGGGWTRQQITTTHQALQIRFVAEWGGDQMECFGGTSFDGTIAGAHTGDQATNLLRPGHFALATQTLAASRFGSVIKLDDVRDTQGPGLGTYWVQSGQGDSSFGSIDRSNPAIIFQFDLFIADEAGMRVINSLHRNLESAGFDVYLWGGQVGRVLAPVSGISVTYVPAPSCLILVAAAGSVAFRRRRN